MAKVRHDHGCDQWIDSSVEPAICSCVKKELLDLSSQIQTLNDENNRLAFELANLKLKKKAVKHE